MLCTALYLALYAALYVGEMAVPAKRRSVTMSDVAAHAGVSIKTVSNVINNWPYVTEETRQKVLAAIEAIGYRPNHTARSLVTGKTKAIGVLVPDVSNPFFGTAIRACEEALVDDGYSLFLCNTNEDAERERYYLEQLLSRGVDGLILWGSRLSPSELEEIIDASRALVTVELGEEPTRPNHTCINVDNRGGSRMATEHLLSEGHRRIGHLAGPLDRVTSRQRKQGYEEALVAAGLEPLPQMTVAAQPSVQGGFCAAERLIGTQKLDAIFCYNDLMALGALLAARHLGLRVPYDLALVGFDDIDVASIIEPPLTTVRIPQAKLGRLTGKVVLEQLRGSGGPERVILCPVELRVRGSSRNFFSEEQEKATLDALISSFSDEAECSAKG